MRNNKKKVKKIFIILFVIIFSHYAIPLCFIGKEQVKMRIAAKEILLPIYLRYGYKMELGRMLIDRESKIFKCDFSINHRKLYKELDMISMVYKNINRYLVKNKDYFLNDGYEIVIYIQTKQAERIFLTNGPIFKEQKGLSKGLKHADVVIDGDFSLLKEFNDLEALYLWKQSEDDLSFLKNFTNLKYIAFDEELNQKCINAVHKILPNCEVKDHTNIHPSWYDK